MRINIFYKPAEHNNFKKYLMKRVIFLIIVTLFPILIYSQDTLQLMNGRKMATKVVGINDSVIVYNLSDEKYNSLKNLNKHLSQWSFGLGLGVTLPYGEIRQYKSYPFLQNTDARSAALHFEINRVLSKVFNFQGEFTSGKLYGLKVETAANAYSKYFNADIHEFSLNLLINLNKLVFKDDSRLQVYAKTGIGLLQFRSVEYKTDSNVYINSYGYLSNGDLYGKMLNCMVVPLGLGINYRLGNNLHLKLEGLMKFTNTKKLDVDISSAKNDRYGITSVGLTYTLANPTVTKDRRIDKSDVYFVKFHNGKKVVTFADTVRNKSIIGSVGDYVAGEEYARKVYKPRIATAGSVLAGLMGGYLAFYGLLVPTFYTVGLSSVSPEIRDINGNLLIPANKADNEYFIQGFKEKSRKIDVRNSLIGGIAGMAAMIIIRTVHVAGKKF